MERGYLLYSPKNNKIYPLAICLKTKDIGYENNDLLVSIKALKNSVARGDSQNVTITVTDFASRPIANAEISGLLKYPGDNYEKEFSGITDSQGKFVYSWIIGENGDVGPLSIEVGVSSQAYPSRVCCQFFRNSGFLCRNRISTLCFTFHTFNVNL